MKKLMTVLIVVALALSCATAALAETNVHIMGNCNVRSSPSLNGKILGTASNGATLKGTGKTSIDSRGVEWYGVSYKGKSGWVSSKYAYITGGSSGKHYEASSGKYVVGDTGKSNVHTGPGLSYKTIGVLHQGESALYQGKTSTDSRGVVWYKITFNGQNAWVSSKYTRIDGKGKATGTVIADGGDSNVRSGPGLDYKKIDVMYQDDEAEFLGKTSTDDRGVLWYKVDFDGSVGWVSSKYASLW